MSEELVEKVARVMYVQQLTGGDYGWNDLPQWKREAWRKSARAAIGVVLEAVTREISQEFQKTRVGESPVHLDSYLAGINSYKAIVRAALESLGAEAGGPE